MPRLPSLTGAEVIRALIRTGFVRKRQTGSHVILADARTTTTVSVPLHAGRTLSRGIVRDIIRQSGLTVEEFRRLLK